MSNLAQMALVHTVDADNPNEHDLRLTNGHLTFLEGHEAIAQKVKIRLWFFRGEWFLDQREGIPYWTKVLVKNPDVPALEAMFRRIIQSSPGIAAVEKISLDYDSANRAASLSFAAKTDEGATIELGPFIVPKPRESSNG
jgi:hypothetical protein